MVIFGKVKSQKDKIMYNAHLLKFKRSKNVNGKPVAAVETKMVVLERRSLTSL